MKRKKERVLCFFLAVILVLVLSACGVESEPDNAVDEVWIVNVDSKKIHRADCYSAERISSKNRREYSGDLETLRRKGYTTCGNCIGYKSHLE